VARTRDPVAHAVRRDAFLDAAQRLMQLKGYAQMSVQDVLDDVGASKGALYHYFDSKAALLEGVVIRMVDMSAAAMAPAVADPGRSALAKFDAVYSGLINFKMQRKELLVAMMKVWLSDDNAVMREKFRRAAIARLTPLLTPVIEQGVAEGVFQTPTPGHTARVFTTLMLGANETASYLFYGEQAEAVTFDEAVAQLSAFGDAFERILGAAPGSLGWTRRLAVLRDWFDIPQED
jgi:AcrR family transcriptional regulator